MKSLALRLAAVTTAVGMAGCGTVKQFANVPDEYMGACQMAGYVPMILTPNALVSRDVTIQRDNANRRYVFARTTDMQSNAAGNSAVAGAAAGVAIAKLLSASTGVGLVAGTIGGAVVGRSEAGYAETAYLTKCFADVRKGMYADIAGEFEQVGGQLMQTTVSRTNQNGYYHYAPRNVINNP